MRGQARPGRAAHEKCSRVLELAGASMAGDVEEGLSDPAPFSRRRMRSEGLHAVEGVDCGGLRRVFDRLFGDIDLSRSLYRRQLLLPILQVPILPILPTVRCASLHICLIQVN